MSKFTDFFRDLFARSDDLPDFRPTRGRRYQTRAPIPLWIWALLVIVAIFALGAFLSGNDVVSLVSTLFPTS